MILPTTYSRYPTMNRWKRAGFGGPSPYTVLTNVDKEHAFQCTPWGICKPIGSGSSVDNVVGSIAYSLTCAFDKTGTACQGIGVQADPAGYAGTQSWGPIILLGVGGVLLYTLVKR